MRMLLALIVLHLATAGVASADDVALARKHYDRARALIKLGDHRGAIKEFELAFQASPRGSLLFNIAREYQVLAEAGTLAEMRRAVEFYQRYLEAEPSAPDRAQVESQVVELKARIASAESVARDTSVPLGKDNPIPPPGEQHTKTRAFSPLDTARSELPIYRRWWFWTLLGGVVLVGAGVGIGIGLTDSAGVPIPSTSLGNGAVSW